MSLVDRISVDLNIDPEYLKNIAGRNNLYKKYYIPKNKGKRLIMQPSRELKVIQYWIVKNIFEFFPISDYSSAYERGCSIQRNARMHSKSKYILHMDIKDFFVSINCDMVNNLFVKNPNVTKELQLSQKDIDYILNIVLYEGKSLVIGSVASPVISNLVMYSFDNELKAELDKKRKYIYTRYADDIVISSEEYIPKNVISMVTEMMKKYGFIPNKGKIFFMNKSTRRQVTGIIIDNNTGNITIGTSRYKKIKSQIYNFLVKNKGDIEQIRGFLTFVESTNKEQYNQLKKIYLRYDKENKLFLD